MYKATKGINKPNIKALTLVVSWQATLLTAMLFDRLKCFNTNTASVVETLVCDSGSSISLLFTLGPLSFTLP